jgi:hypothetical protein
MTNMKARKGRRMASSTTCAPWRTVHFRAIGWVPIGGRAG